MNLKTIEISKNVYKKHKYKELDINNKTIKV